MDENQLSKLINFTNLYKKDNREYKIITFARTRKNDLSDCTTLNVIVSPTDMPYVSYVYEYSYFLKNFKDTSVKFYA